MSSLAVILALAWVQAPAGPPPALQAVLERARPGDTVRVAAGVHAGGLVIDRPLVLLGEPGAVLDGGGRGTAVLVTADSVTLRGLTIRGGGGSLTDDEAAVKLVRCTGCVVEGNRIERSLHGIYLQDSRGVTVRGNAIEGDASQIGRAHV